jgi:hypothetical protein
VDEIEDLRHRRVDLGQDAATIAHALGRSVRSVLAQCRYRCFHARPRQQIERVNRILDQLLNAQPAPRTISPAARSADVE